MRSLSDTRLRDMAVCDEPLQYDRASRTPAVWFRHDPRLYESDYPIPGRTVDKIIGELKWEKMLAARYTAVQSRKGTVGAQDERFRRQKYFDQPCQRCHEEVARSRGMCNRCYQQTRRDAEKS